MPQPHTCMSLHLKMAVSTEHRQKLETSFRALSNCNEHIHVHVYLYVVKFIIIHTDEYSGGHLFSFVTSFPYSGFLYSTSPYLHMYLTPLFFVILLPLCQKYTPAPTHFPTFHLAPSIPQILYIFLPTTQYKQIRTYIRILH